MPGFKSKDEIAALVAAELLFWVNLSDSVQDGQSACVRAAAAHIRSAVDGVPELLRRLDGYAEYLYEVAKAAKRDEARKALAAACSAQEPDIAV